VHVRFYEGVERTRGVRVQEVELRGHVGQRRKPAAKRRRRFDADGRGAGAGSIVRMLEPFARSFFRGFVARRRAAALSVADDDDCGSMGWD
jgi:hypothetical protein